jgi:tetratricopeptide (TPR) repeat protein
MGVELDEAERLIRRALELEPDDGFYVDSLGWVYFQRGDYRHAVEQLERAVELAGEDPTVAEHLGDAYQRGGHPRDALRLYRDALVRAKENVQIERLKDKIRALEGAARTEGAGL